MLLLLARRRAESASDQHSQTLEMNSLLEMQSPAEEEYRLRTQNDSAGFKEA
jgi:hypothetical protein